MMEMKQCQPDAARWSPISAVEKLLQSGVIQLDNGSPPSFYFVRPKEAVLLMETCSLPTRTLLGLEGLVAGHQEKVNALRVVT